MGKFLRIGCVLICLATIALAADAKKIAQAAERVEREGDTLQAYLLYSRAVVLDPGNASYAQRIAALQTTGALRPNVTYSPDPADETIGTAFEAETATGRDYLESQQADPPVKLAASSEKKSFDLKGDSKTVVEKVAGAYGILIVFAGDYQPVPAITFRVSDLGFEEALRAVENASNSFLVPVTSRLAIVARDTPPNRAQMSPVMVMALPIPERLTVQEAQEIVTAVQQTLEIRRISVDPGRHTIYVRDQAAKVYAAKQMLTALSRPRAQIALEVELITTSNTSSLTYGLSLPNSISLVDFGSKLGNIPSVTSGITNFVTFGGGATLLGMGIADATVFATVSKASAQSLLRANVVSVDGQPVSLHIGDRYPVIQNGYYGTTTGTGTVYTPPPTINFVDLGLVLKVTPSVHAESEVTLDVDAEYKVLGAVGANGIPAIGNSQFQGKVRLKADEWAVIAGLVTVSDAETRTGFPFISDIPVLGRLLSQNSPQRSTSTTLVVLKPHLVVSPPWQSYAGNPIWVGTETRPLSTF